MTNWLNISRLSYYDTKKLKESLGTLAYDNRVEYAKLGTTIIDGGYLQTVLINADFIQAGTLSADRLAVGSIEVTKLGTTIIEGGYIKADLLDVNTVIAKKLTADTDVSAYLVAVPFPNWAMISAFDTDYSIENSVWDIYGSGIQTFLNIVLKGMGVFHTGIGSFNTGSVMDPANNNEAFSVYAQTAEGGGRSWGMGWSGAGFVNGVMSVDSTGFTFYFGTNSFGLDNAGLWKRINNGAVEYL